MSHGNLRVPLRFWCELINIWRFAVARFSSCTDVASSCCVRISCQVKSRSCPRHWNISNVISRCSVIWYPDIHVVWRYPMSCPVFISAEDFMARLCTVYMPCHIESLLQYVNSSGILRRTMSYRFFSRYVTSCENMSCHVSISNVISI